MKQDILNRTEFVDRIVQFINTLSDMKKGACFAIDGKWGSGKSFVIDMIEPQLRNTMDESSAYSKFLLVHYNCWQYDYYEEPSIAMVSAILDNIENEERVTNVDGKVKVAWSLFKEEIKNMAGKFAENHIGVNVVDVLEKFQDEESVQKAKKTVFDPVFAFKQTIEEARQTIRKIAEERTIVIVVDELDRCVPAYAIKVLERLHHFFDGLNNVIVLIAVDSAQLNHSVKQIYGDETDERAYLKKFIQMTFRLDTGEMSGAVFGKYNEYLSSFNFENEEECRFFEEIFQTIWYGIDMRTLEKEMERVAVIHRLVAGNLNDPAIALFEVLSVRFFDVMGYDIISLIDMEYDGGTQLQKTCPRKVVDFLKKMSKQALTGACLVNFEGYPEAYYLYDNLLGRSFYYIFKGYTDSDFVGGKKYRLENNWTYSDEVERVTGFVKMLELIR